MRGILRTRAPKQQLTMVNTVLERPFMKPLRQMCIRDRLSNGKYRYECSIVIDGISYCIAGVSSEEEFVKIIERLTY